MGYPDPPEAAPPTAAQREAGRADERAELARHIDQLMAQPARGRPAVTVVGDDAVFAIWPPLPEDGGGTPSS
ncbi:MAG: hypothetical protein ABS78_11580 [Phenylobacterium sp. SCN 70-31]|nr:MAG: hypothetical protein ABS78_11580 [Phenylobacterium sp. SCN 70-31]